MLSIVETLIESNQEVILPLLEVRFLTSDKYGMTIEYNPDKNRIGDDYFKVYQGTKLKMKGDEQTPRARISFFSPSYVTHYAGSSEPKWEMDTKARENLMALLQEPNPDYPTRTNWNQLIKSYNVARQEAYLPGRDKNVVFLRNQLKIPNYLDLK